MIKVSHVWNIPYSADTPAPVARQPAAKGSSCVALMPTNQRTVIVGRDRSLTYALEHVLDTWESMAAHGEFTEQTLDKFGLLLKRFERYAQLRGAAVLDDVTQDLAEDFITAPGRSRHGHVSNSAAATMRLRRSVVRAAYRTLRELKLSDTDPTRYIDLPRRAVGDVRPLTEDETIDLRHHASFVTRPSRHGAAAALALAGGHSGEIGHIRVRDLDVQNRRVWMHGSTKTDPRWCPLDNWGFDILVNRARFVSARQLRPDSAPRARLAVSDRHASDAALQARVCVALRDLLTRIGLADEADVKPSSVTAWAGVETFERTGRIEEAARLLGLRSLDRAAAVIGHAWREQTLPEYSPEVQSA
ncbi:integrase [Streptomyces sp. DASNCL29]|uniref:integrase n=1 Tax=Streptomyces sp. DASNCL29 TaxID=2583819 RepID=UPI00110FA43F|nr:integrase [Streptomyces sp. DASNCL29]TMU92882.1 integrase [Streptomyces sp. DASNCL29]